MPEFRNYSFTNVSVIFGVIELKGFADGDDVVTIETETDQFTDLAGAKGDVVRSQTNDNRVTVTVKLLQNALTNSLLNAQYLLDRESGVGVAAMIIQDKETNESFVINNAWISKQPTIIRGQNINMMEWVFRGDYLTPIIDTPS